jgi:hypothetical protein
MSLLRLLFLALITILFVSGCAHKPVVELEKNYGIFIPTNIENSVWNEHAPAFIVYDVEKSYNRIGRPSARHTDNGGVELYVDPDSPVIFTDRRTFETSGGTYTNLIYRIHFEKVPFSLIPFHLTAGSNSGILVIITLNAKGQPILVTNAGTCGCYAAVIPTSNLPEEALPKEWDHQGLISVYGETLPAMLDYDNIKAPRLLIQLRPGVHRVMDIAVVEEQNRAVLTQTHRIPTPLESVENLEKIPLNGEHTSFYHETGIRKGHVKGSIKPWESLLLSLISLDLFVGSDKVYGDTAKSNNPFYTSLKPWNRKTSDMNDFAGFLKFFGWRL